MQISNALAVPKIMVVDDNAANLTAMEVVLQDLGAEIVCVGSGAEALEMLLGAGGLNYCLLLLDVQMPDIDGYELAELIRKRADLKHIPIIFVSAVLKSELNIFHGYELGAVDFISKPFEPVILRSKVSVFLDIARYIQKISSLTEARRKAEYENKLKSAFLSNISHEIRTPLNAIIGFGHLLSFGQLTDKQKDYVKKIQSAGDHLMGIVTNILEIAKLEAGKMELSVTKVNISAVLDDICRLTADSMAEKGLVAGCYIDNNVPTQLIADEQRLKQVLLNYINNAIKFTDVGEISVRVKLLSQTGNHVSLRFSVSDTGIGLTEAKMSELFQNFQQADSSTSRQYGGIGMGLAISKQFVKLMDGEVGVESVFGKGSTFWFTVKLECPDVDLVTEAESLSAQKIVGSEALPSKLLAGVRVLLIEDTWFDQVVITEIFKAEGAAVELATNGFEGVRLAQQNAYDLILMDLQMPEMDGLEAARQIRQTPHLLELPIFALTGDATAEEQAACLEVGMNGFLTKPIDPDFALQTIRQILAK